MEDGVAYYRQSKDAKDGIERQREKVRKLAADREINLIAELEDNDVSATKRRKRPGYEQGMAMVKSGRARYLLVSVMDRLYRKVIELEGIIEDVEEFGFMVLSYEGTYDLSTPTGRMVARQLCAVAQQEVETKAARQRDANQQAARAGKRNRTGARPFGWEDDRLTHREPEAQAIRDAADAILVGASLQSIIRMWWDARGLRPPLAPFGPLQEGNPWSHTTVRRVLTNPQNAGLRVYQGEVIGHGDWTPILTPEKQATVAAILSDSGRVMPRGSVSLLGSLAECSCGNKIKHGTRKNTLRQAGVPYGIYRCNTATVNGRPGPHASVQAAIIDKYVQDVVIATCTRPDAAKAFARKNSGHDVLKLREEAKQNSDGLTQLAGDAAMGIIPRSIYLDAATRIKARQAEIDELIAEAGQQDAVALLVSADDVAAEWKKMDISLKRAVLNSLCSRIILRSPGCGCRNPDMERIVSFRWRT